MTLREFIVLAQTQPVGILDAPFCVESDLDGYQLVTGIDVAPRTLVHKRLKDTVIFPVIITDANTINADVLRALGRIK